MRAAPSGHPRVELALPGGSGDGDAMAAVDDGPIVVTVSPKHRLARRKRIGLATEQAFLDELKQAS